MILLCLFPAFLCCSSSSEETDLEMEMLKNQFTYYAFPDICKVNNDSLAMVFYSGFGHVSNPQRTSSETELGGKIVITYSTDQGRSWNIPEVLVDTEADDRDPSISIDSNKRIYVVFFKRRIVNEKPYVDGTFMIFSDDFGRTWSNIEKILDGYVVSSPIREFSKNHLILPVYTSKTRFGRHSAAITESNDGGNSWTNPIRIVSESDSLFNEVDIGKIRGDTLLSSMRPTNLDMEMEYSVSYDNGKSWKKSLPFGHKGISPYFFSSEDIILYSYANVKGINLTVIKNSSIGNIGSAAYIVDDNGNTYPSIAEVAEGEFFIVYHNDKAIAPYSYLKGRYFKVEKGKISMLSNPFPIILPSPNR